MEIHTLAIQMGTSIGMIERHYSHLTPRLKKDMLTGRRYELSRDEFEGRQGDEWSISKRLMAVQSTDRENTSLSRVIHAVLTYE